jgi:ATP-dependent helicase/nuclease subunit A
MRRDLTEEQAIAIEITDRAVALMAAAGSGKTTVLVERYLRLLAQGLSPADILLVTFTNEAADQLKARIVDRLITEEQSATTIAAVEASSYIGTLHGFCFRILEQYGSYLDYPAIETIVTSLEFAALFEEEYQRWLAERPAEELSRLYQYFGQYELKNVVRQCYTEGARFKVAARELSAEERPMVEALFDPLQHFSDELRRRWNAAGRYTFDDLETGAGRLLKEVATVQKRLAAQFKAVLVDEFQDTSRAQWEILERIVPAGDPRLFVVGDPKQSIYRFRNADVRVFLSVHDRIAETGGAPLALTYNFRSAPKLIAAINLLAQTLFAGSEVPFQAMRAGLPDEGKGSLNFLRYATTRAEMVASEIRVVVEEIKSIVARGISPHEIVLLFRVADRVEGYLKALRDAGIAAVARRNESLFAAYGVLDLTHYLKAVLDPLDDFALAAFLRSDYVGWSYRDLAEAKHRPGEFLFEKIQTDDRIAWFVEVIGRGEWDVRELLKALFAHARTAPTLDARFLEVVSALTASSPTLAEAVNRLRIWEREGSTIAVKDGATREPAVHLMTVHAAKGLEFGHVFLVDNLRQSPRRAPPLRLEHGFPPGIRYRDREGEVIESEAYTRIGEVQADADQQESKRILYVALTRARETLTIVLPEDGKLIPKQCWGAWLLAAQK